MDIELSCGENSFTQNKGKSGAAVTSRFYSHFDIAKVKEADMIISFFTS